MNQEKKNYKNTLNLPKTSFSMKASLFMREPQMQKAWVNDGLYQEIRKKSKGKPSYILHDGPPYANGHIHIGHALNKIIKDLIVKFETMRGFDALYVPGWDCHGLPIELQCLKEMGKRKEDVDRNEFRKKARKYAEKFVKIQCEEFKRLGIFAEWDNPYLTMDFKYQSTIAESFLKLFEDGYIEQHLRPVPWCPSCETALADAELEYEDKISKSVYVKFKIDKNTLNKKIDNKLLEENKTKPFYLLIWTTTPWTLPANVGVALHPDLDYSFVILGNEVFVLATSRVSFIENLSESALSVKGKVLEGIEYEHPFIKRTGKAILADYVSNTDGTGIVHIAPGHGEDDYKFGHLENKLLIISPVDSKGRFTDEFDFCKGENVFKANVKITELLENKGLLLKEEDHSHSYPYCWRCKKPIIFRATTQWFMKIDHRDLRKKMMHSIYGEIRFIPEWGSKRMGAMVENRPEWCLSRQRYWGVPIPVIKCAECENVNFVSESKEKIIKLFSEEGADAWFSHKTEDFLPLGFKCSKCRKTNFEKETDIIDVWFDSGVSHQAVLRQREDLDFPADLYLEGSDQHRGWFQSALTTAIALEDKSSFKGVLTHGFVMDGVGKKMSKSAGNVVTPQDVMKEFGADILRLWVISCDYNFDVRLSKDILKQLADAYRKIRNTLRYLLSNLYDFNIKENKVPIDKLHPLDRWVIGEVDSLVEKVTESYESFEFHQIYKDIYEFCIVDLSSYYLDVLKDTLYTLAPNAWLRRSAQTALFYILSRLVKLIAPIMSFTADEVWRAYPLEDGVSSVHVSEWPIKTEEKEDAFGVWEHIRELRDALNPFIEKKREDKIIGGNLDAKIIFHLDSEKSIKIIDEYIKELPRMFVVSQVERIDNAEETLETVELVSKALEEKIKLSVSVLKADGEKCVRCWNYSKKIGDNTEFPDVCPKCIEALKG